MPKNMENNEFLKSLADDTDGLVCYECLANNISEITDPELTQLIDRMIAVDHNGQFLASTAKYLHAIDPARFAQAIKTLVSATIDKDREHRYLADLMAAIYGPDCLANADQLTLTDNNFRRIYKRLYPKANAI